MAGYPGSIWTPAANGNFAYGRTKPISRITFHHIVGDAGAAIARFKTPGVEVSSTYVIGTDGCVYQMVDEANTPYTDGNYDSNSRAITIEHAGGGSTPYTEAMYQSSARLVSYLIKKYGITDFKRHRDIIATACPGTLDVERIIRDAKGNNDVIKASDLAQVRIIMSEVEGWNGHEVHSGKHDKQIMGAWQGKEWNDFIWHAWSVQNAHRIQLTDNITALQAQVAQRDKLISEIKAKAELSDSLQKKVDALQTEQAQDQATGNAIMRFLGRLFRTSN